MTTGLLQRLDSSTSSAEPASISEVARVPAPRGERVFRWDLDKTYLVSHFESLRGLLAVPFEKGTDKVALPGVAAVIKGLHRAEEQNGRAARVFFLSASPPQIGTAIRDKLEIDGIRYEGITFKNQVAHLVRGRFDALREQIGYKLDQLLISARSLRSETVEYLFGDDWESDPFVYSVYADVLAGRVGKDELGIVLARARVHRHYIERIMAHLDWLAAEGTPRHRVGAIFILRQRPVPPFDLEGLGPRLVWFDDYVECVLALYVRALVDVDAVLEVARASALDRQAIAQSLLSAADHPPVELAHLAPARRRLLDAGLMTPVPAGRVFKRLACWVRERRGLPRLADNEEDFLPDYPALVDTWSYRRRKERR